MNNRVAIYTRISSDREEEGKEEGLGVARQEEDCRKLAEAKGLNVLHIISDNNESAYLLSKKRKGWERVKSLVEDGSIDGIVAWHTDRLYRHPIDLEDIIQLVEDKKLTIYTVTAGEMDLNTSNGKLVARLLGNVARNEVEHKAERQAAKHRQLAAAGHWHGGKIPTGYKQVDGKGPLVIDEPVAEALRTSAKLLLSGHSLRSVTKAYREATGHNVADTALRRVLVGPVIAGIRIYSPEHSRDDKTRMQLPDRIIRVPAKWDAILDEETWLDLKTLLLNPARKTRGVTSELSLLSGLLICGRPDGPDTVCGKSLGYGQKAYICNYTSGGCNKMSISTDRIEDFIERQVTEMISAKNYPMPSKKAKTEDEVTQRKRERLQKNYDDSFEMFVQGTLSREQLEVAKARLTEQIEKMGPKPKPVATVKAENSKLTSLIAHWDEAGKPERRMVIKHLIDRVIVTAPDLVRAKAKGHRFDYDRVEVQWAEYDEDGIRVPMVPLKVKTKADETRAKK